LPSTQPLYFGVLGCFAACFIISRATVAPLRCIFTHSLRSCSSHPLLDLSFIRGPHRLLLHLYINEPSFNYYPVQVLYPIIPWLGVMGLGWCFGVLLNRLDDERARKLAFPLAFTGIALIVVFIAIRWLNGYGNLVQRQGNTIQAWCRLQYAT